MRKAVTKTDIVIMIVLLQFFADRFQKSWSFDHKDFRP